MMVVVSQSDSSVTQLCLILGDPMNRSMPGLPSIINSQTLLKLMSIESAMPSSHLILCCPLLLPPSVFPRIRVFSNESVLRIRWPKYWSFSFIFSISPSNEHPGLISLGWTGWISLQSKGLSRVFSNTTVQKHQFFSLIMRHRTQPAATPSHTDFQSVPDNFLQPWFLSFGFESSRPHEIEVFSFSENGT